MATSNIVTVNVSRTIAPAPSTLQRTGALVSQGGTTLSGGARSLLTELDDLTPLLPAPVSHTLTSLAWASGVVTGTATAAHGITIGQSFQVTIAGAVPTAYNGLYTATATTTTAFTYALASNPGSETTPGTYTAVSPASEELISMATEFFAQGNSLSVYVLEVGAGTAAQGVDALQTWINANPKTIYSYLVPREWDSDSAGHTALVELTKLFAANTAKTYFFITTDEDNFVDYVGTKSAVYMIESVDPVLPTIEFSMAAMLWRTLSYQPSNVNKVAPTSFAFLIAVTAGEWTGPQLAAFKAGFVNYVDTGAEGGISDTILKWGTTGDGRDFSYWYSVDWVQINVELDLANEIINGSNNPTNPLYYDQPGINRLQARAQQTFNRGVTFGLINTSQLPVVEAVPFIQYTQDNPSDYPIGAYNGLSCSYVPSRGFTSIVFNVNVTDFIAA